MSARVDLIVTLTSSSDHSGWYAEYELQGRTAKRYLRRADLEQLDLPAMFEGTGAKVEALLRADGLDQGARLTEWLFGVPGEQATWLRELVGAEAKDEPTVASITADLVLRTNDKLLLQQPWHILAWSGRSLIEYHWTIQLQVAWHTVEGAELPERLALLLVLPEHDPALGAAEHEEAVREVLGLIDAVTAHPDSAPVVRTKDELIDALSGSAWDVIYFRGHGLMKDGEAVLRLDPEREDQRHDDMTLRSLRTEIDDTQDTPAMVYLNCCSTGGGGWTGAGTLLEDVAAYVLAHHGPVTADVAASRGLSVLEAVLVDGRDPATAFCDSARRISGESPLWMAGVVHRSRSSWNAPQRRQFRATRGRLWPFRLDRRPHRALLSDEIRSMTLRKDPRVRGVSVVAVGDDSDHVPELGAVMLEHVRSTLGRDLPVLELSAQLPPEHKPTGVAWDNALRNALQRGDQADLDDALAQRRKELPGRGEFLVWVDFGTWPEPDGSFRVGKAVHWALRCATWTRNIDVPGARFVWWLGLTQGAAAHAKLASMLHHKAARDARTAPASTVLLPPLGGVDADDLYTFLRDHDPELLPDDWWCYARRVHAKVTASPAERAPYAKVAGILDAVKTVGTWRAYEPNLPPDPDDADADPFS